MEAEDAIQVGNDQIAQGQDKGRDGLNDELMGSLHAVTVIEDSYQVDNQSAYGHCHR